MVRNHGYQLKQDGVRVAQACSGGGESVTAICIPHLAIEELTITRRLDGRHIRIANGRRHRAVGRYASVKTGQSIPWESRLELDDIRVAEVDTTVVSYVAQPETLRWRSSGCYWRYTPDRVDWLVDDGWRVVEVKDEFDPNTDLAYGEKLDMAASIYAALGGCLVIRDKRAIRVEPEYSAIEEVQAYRRAVVTIAHIESVNRALRPGGMSMEQLTNRLELSKPTLCAMMVQRIIHINLVDGLGPDSQVSLVAERLSCAA